MILLSAWRRRPVGQSVTSTTTISAMLAKIVVCLAILALASATLTEPQYQGLFRSFIKHHNKVRFVFTP